MRDFAAAVAAAPLPQLPRDLPPPHPVWGGVPPPKSNEARQALLSMLLSAGGLAGVLQEGHGEAGRLSMRLEPTVDRLLFAELCTLPFAFPPRPAAEEERLAAWASPLDSAAVPQSAAASLTAPQWAVHVRTAWAEVSPRLAVALARRFPASAAIKMELQRLVAQDAGEAAVQVGWGGCGCCAVGVAGRAHGRGA